MVQQWLTEPAGGGARLGSKGSRAPQRERGGVVVVVGAGIVAATVPAPVVEGGVALGPLEQLAKVMLSATAATTAARRPLRALIARVLVRTELSIRLPGPRSWAWWSTRWM